MKDLFQNEVSDEDSKLLIAAHRLAILFGEEKNIPQKFKNSSEKLKKINEDTQIMIKFRNSVNIWKDVISKILEKIEYNMAWRFINLNPLIEENLEHVVYNKDFNVFTEYFSLRRDVENCDDYELGCLAQLYTSFQKTIEKEIYKLKPDYVAIDFEHATRVKGTICSVGIVSFKNDTIIDTYYSLIKPPDNKYEFFNTSKHKINAETTVNAPSFTEVFPEIHKRINNNTLVAHGAYHTDKICLEQAIEIANINTSLNINWVCTQHICNCSLDIACKACGIELSHHQALSDAIGCGILYSKYLKKELPIDEFQKLKDEKKANSGQKTNHYPMQLSGEVLKPDYENAKNKSNPFYMKKVVISGFDDVEKERIAKELKELGADIDGTVGNKTNFLIAGDNVGPSKLSKMQSNIIEGRDAKIISISEFNELKENN